MSNDSSNSQNPFKKPENVVETWRNQTTGQINQKIIKGPDKDVHRYGNPQNGRTGQTGNQRPGR